MPQGVGIYDLPGSGPGSRRPLRPPPPRRPPVGDGSPVGALRLAAGGAAEPRALRPQPPERPRAGAAAAPGRTAVAAAPGRHGDRTGIVTETLRLETAAARRSPSGPGSTARAPARRVCQWGVQLPGPGPGQQLRRPAGPELAGLPVSESSEYYDHNAMLSHKSVAAAAAAASSVAGHPVSRTGIVTVTLRPGSL